MKNTAGSRDQENVDSSELAEFVLFAVDSSEIAEFVWAFENEYMYLMPEKLNWVNELAVNIGLLH